MGKDGTRIWNSMARKWTALLWVAVAALCACEKESTLGEYQQTLVVEGWIENDDFPVVIVTKTMPVSSEFQYAGNLEDYLVRWAKVTVSDGETSVVLTGRYDEMYFPPYVYTTSRIRGEVGKTYYLTVEYEDFCATASTTVCEPPDVESFRVDKCADNDTLYQITARFRDRPQEKNYYQLFTKVGEKTRHYLGSFLGSIDDEGLKEGLTELPVYRGHMMDEEDYTPYFCKGEKVSVKFAQLDADAYRFWDQYTKSESLSSNMFLSVPASMPSNIKGGVGYWSGYGAVNAHFVVGY